MIIFKIVETGAVVPQGVGFTHNDTKYPPNWLDLATEQDLADHGIEAVEVSDPDPEPAGAVVPSEISAAQARVQLRRSGLRDQVEALVSGTNGETRDWYEYASVWRRDNPNIAGLAAQIGLSDADIDALFIAAAAIE